MIFRTIHSCFLRFISLTKITIFLLIISLVHHCAEANNENSENKSERCSKIQSDCENGTPDGNCMKCVCRNKWSGENCNKCSLNCDKGSFPNAQCSKCVCDEGYIWDSRSGCIDLNECESNLNVCDPLSTCLNTEGSYTCSECPRGYYGSGYERCFHGPFVAMVFIAFLVTSGLLYLVGDTLHIIPAKKTRKQKSE